MRRIIYLLPLVSFVVIAGNFSLRPGHDIRELPPALIDRPTPDFSPAGLASSTKLEDLRGQLFAMNFFAFWCVPCWIEHPLLMRLAEQNHLLVYSAAYKDEPEGSTQLLATFGDPYRQVGVDRDGRVGLDFGMHVVPETYVIDRAGRIRHRFVGPLTAELADRELLPLLSGLERS